MQGALLGHRDQVGTTGKNAEGLGPAGKMHRGLPGDGCLDGANPGGRQLQSQARPPGSL